MSGLCNHEIIFVAKIVSYVRVFFHLCPSPLARVFLHKPYPSHVHVHPCKISLTDLVPVLVTEWVINRRYHQTFIPILSYLFIRVHATLQPALSVCLSVRLSVPLSFFSAYGRFWSYCSCPIARLVYFFTAPAHPHATCITVWPCFFFAPPRHL